MDIGSLANDWLANLSGPASDDPLYRGPDDHWLYDLSPRAFAALFELPPPVRNVAAAANPTPYIVETRGPGFEILRNPWAPLSAGVPTMETTWFDQGFGPPLYGDPLTRIALGQAGKVDPAGPYYGGVDPSYQVFNLSDAAIATQRLFPGWTLPKIGLPALGFPNTPKATQQQAAPGAGWATWLLYGGLALAAVLLLRRR